VLINKYRNFEKDKKVLKMIIERYEKMEKKKMELKELVMEKNRKKLVLELNVWIDYYNEEFSDKNKKKKIKKMIYL
jgi:hypothetical protein